MEQRWAEVTWGELGRRKKAFPGEKSEVSGRPGHEVQGEVVGGNEAKPKNGLWG